jgi:hypothetical protein
MPEVLVSDAAGEYKEILEAHQDALEHLKWPRHFIEFQVI